jgi:bacterioferritin
LSVKKETTLLEDLNQAFAAETLAAMRYLYLSKIASGINSPPLAKMLDGMAKDEWEHAGAFMERIIQLGGVPISKPVEIEKKSFHAYSDPPRRGNDLKAVIKDGLKLERSAVEFYQHLATKTRDSDPITYRLVMDVMVDEAKDEQRLAALLD